MAVGAARMDDKTVNLQTLKDMVRVFVQNRNWTEGHNPKNLAMSISIEAAELMEIFQWESIDGSWKIKDDEERFVHLKEELSDVLIYCLSLANQLNIDVAEAIECKMAKNEKKYPVSRG
jgi:NTP pyrophosphatase (non-canonical NTP hydrolase)